VPPSVPAPAMTEPRLLRSDFDALAGRLFHLEVRVAELEHMIGRK